MKVAGQIEMLVKQKEEISEKDFNLEAWKSTAATLISTIFGKDDPRILTVEKLKIDYGSWALRDASSKYDPVTTCKRIAGDLMDLCVKELKALEDGDQSFILEILGDHLTGSQMKEIKSILTDKDEKKRKSALLKVLQNYKAPKLAQILGTVLLSSNK